MFNKLPTSHDIETCSQLTSNTEISGNRYTEQDVEKELRKMGSATCSSNIEIL
jgi:hypothetical protein